MRPRIEDYAMIGDCYSAALIGRDGSIDWLCWPRFDAPACFPALLGTSENGRWLIAPVSASPNVSRRYLADTLILETEFQTETGTATVVEFMPLLMARRDHSLGQPSRRWHRPRHCRPRAHGAAHLGRSLWRGSQNGR